MWSKLSVPIIALVAVLASSVRTLQTAAEIYTASGTHIVGVFIAAVSFTIAAEGALFVLALAQEAERLKLRRENQPRRVMSLRSLWQGILIRLGLRDPLTYDEIQGGNHIGLVMLIAFFFAAASNTYMGLRPLLQQVDAVSLQDFIAGLWFAPAELQLTFIVDIAAVLFPPLMALAAGHLTARFAAEISEQAQHGRQNYELELESWRQAYTNPLETDEGQALLDQYREQRLAQKRHKAQADTGAANSGTPLALSRAIRD